MLVAQRVVKVGRLFLFETRDGGVGPNHNNVSGLDESLLIMYCSMYCPPSASPGSQGSHFQHGQRLREIFHPMSTMFDVSIHGVATIPTIFGMAMQMLPDTEKHFVLSETNKCPILQLHSMQIPMKCSFKSVSHDYFSASSVPRGTVVFFGLVQTINDHFEGVKIPYFLINPKIILLVTYHYISPFPTDNHFMNFIVNVPPNFVPVKSRVLNFHVSR